jgi:hypothetical protein
MEGEKIMQSEEVTQGISLGKSLREILVQSKKKPPIY